MQINDIFHNCPEQQQQQQSDPKDLGSKFPRSKMLKNTCAINLKYFMSVPFFQRYLVISIIISKIWSDAIFYAFYDDTQWGRNISEGLF